MGDFSEELDRLKALRDYGVLSEDDYLAAKAAVYQRATADSATASAGAVRRVWSRAAARVQRAWNPSSRRRRRVNRVLIVALGWLLLVLPINIYKLAARGPILVLGDELVSRLSSQLQAIGSESEAIAEIRCPEKKNLRDGDSENCTVIRMNGEILTIRVTAHKSDSGARLVVSMVSVTAGPPWQYPSTTPTTSEPSAPYVAPQVTLVPSPYSDPGPVVVRPELVRQAGGAAACSEKVYKGLQAFLEPLISGGSGSQSDAEGEAARSAGGRDTAVYKLILQAYEQGLGRSLPADGESAYIAAYEVCGAPVPSESG